MSPHTLQLFIIGLPALLLSLSVHEFAHAWIATRLGDDTPSRQGRLTLSPVPHMDMLGSLIFPSLLMLSGTGWFFGWAKPVQFQPVNFTRKVSMWQGAALTAVGGPLSNLVLALLAAIGLRLSIGAGLSGDHLAVRFFDIMFTLNVLLAIFNLFPMPPLDGGYLIPRRLSQVKEFMQRYAMILFVLVFFVPVGNSIGFRIINPVRVWVERGLLQLVGLAI